MNYLSFSLSLQYLSRICFRSNIHQVFLGRTVKVINVGESLKDFEFQMKPIGTKSIEFDSLYIKDYDRFLSALSFIISYFRMSFKSDFRISFTNKFNILHSQDIQHHMKSVEDFDFFFLGSETNTVCKSINKRSLNIGFIRVIMYMAHLHKRYSILVIHKRASLLLDGFIDNIGNFR